MPPVSKFRTILGWVKEFLWFITIFLQAIPGLLLRIRPHRKGHRQPIVIVADFFCSGLFYRRLRRSLIKAGFPVYVAKSGHIFKPLREHGRSLSRLLNDWNIEDGIILAHGAGGLASLSISDASRQRIEHLVSLGTPFHGSRLFLWTPVIPALRDNAVGSDYLLINRMNALLFTSFTPFIAWQDEWIVPFSLANFGQGRDLIFDQVGRFNLVKGRENIQTIVDYLDEAYPEQPALALALKASEQGRPDPAPVPAKKKKSAPAHIAKKKSKKKR